MADPMWGPTQYNAQGTLVSDDVEYGLINWAGAESPDFFDTIEEAADAKEALLKASTKLGLNADMSIVHLRMRNRVTVTTPWRPVHV